jgi:outer membrane lipoprotein-sorting protein
MLTPILALLPLLLPAAPADEFQQTLARMDEAAAAFKALSADIRKLHHTTIINEDEKSSGTVVVRRPKPKELQVLFNIKEPEPMQASFSDHTGELYNPKTMLVDVYDLDKKLGAGLSGYMLLGFGSSTRDLGQAYTIAPGGPEAIGGYKTYKIVLTPRKPDTVMQLSKVELWISDETGVAVQQKLYTGPDYDVMTYSNMKISPNIPESAVKLVLPRGAKRQYPQK